MTRASGRTWPGARAARPPDARGAAAVDGWVLSARGGREMAAGVPNRGAWISDVWGICESGGNDR